MRSHEELLNHKKQADEAEAKIRELKKELLVVIMTAEAGMKNAVEAMKRGAYDYLTKPFGLGELEVRVGAILKRQRIVTAPEKQRLSFEKLVIDPERREVTLNNQLIPLTALEFDLLRFLAILRS